MSHELRTPLNAILGYADLLGAEIAGRLNGAQKQQLGRIGESGRHLLSLIEQILSLSRIEAGREQIRAKRFDARVVVREAASMLEPAVRDNGLAFSVVVPGAPLELNTDAGRVRQVLLNLLSNATKFTESGRVELRLRSEDDAAVFEIADTGPGIAAEDRERIFHPFEQVEQGVTRTKGGAGLGLSVSVQLANLPGGALMVESEPGRGSTFALRLPRVGPPGG